jgi:hypothetical protein
MHCYDLDLSLQFIDAGYRVYVMTAYFHHLIQKRGANVEVGLSSRGRSDYLETVGGDDARYFDTVTGQFRDKWGHMLPITRVRSPRNENPSSRTVCFRWVDLAVQDNIVVLVAGNQKCYVEYGCWRRLL